MKICWPRIVFLLTFAFLAGAGSTVAYAQSKGNPPLGDVAREIRAERQERGNFHPRVFTNDDIASPAQVSAPSKAEESLHSDEAANEAKKDATGEGVTDEAGKEKVSKKAAKTENAQEKMESERDKRSQEVNKRYLDKIADIRTKIKGAQDDLARLQRDEVESTSEFHRSAGAAPTVGAYEEQQRVLREQMETQRNLIQTLNVELEDAQEAARHAGVPHATD
jgi:hypothetical protein